MLGEKITLNPGNYLSPDPAGAPIDVVRRGQLGVVVVMTVAVWLLAGCSDDDGESASSTTTATTETTESSTTTEQPATTTTEARTPEEDVEAAYWESVAVLDDILQDPNPDDPRLAETLVDPNLSHVRDLLEELVEDGISTEWTGGEPPPRDVQSVEVSGDVATVFACEIDNARAIDSESGEVLDDGVLSSLVEVTFRQVDDQWMVSSSATSAEWLDGLGCER